MKFSTREDIAAPMEQVFAAISDFDGFERAIMRRGVEVRRTDSMSAPAPGMTWASRFPFRGKPRDLTAVMTRYEKPEVIEVTSTSTGMGGLMKVELVALSPRQTRLQVELDIKPNTLSARLLLQSLRLAKSSLTRRFKSSVKRFADGIEAGSAAGPGRG